MTALLTCLKKEYWEERSLLLGLPIGLAAILIMSLIIALFIGVRYSDQFDIDFNIGSWSSDHNGSSVPLNFTEELQFDDSHNLIQHESELNSMANSLLQSQIDYSANGFHDYGNNANNAMADTYQSHPPPNTPLSTKTITRIIPKGLNKPLATGNTCFQLASCSPAGLLERMVISTIDS